MGITEEPPPELDFNYPHWFRRLIPQSTTYNIISKGGAVIGRMVVEQDHGACDASHIEYAGVCVRQVTTS